MYRSVAAPAGGIRRRSAEKPIISETDLKGRITYVNDAFLELCGYTHGELLGRPHSIVRHPDMPKGLFGLLWKRLRLGEETCLLLRNRRKNGQGYWMMSLVAPIADGQSRAAGYRSVSHIAWPDTVAEIEPFYRRMRQRESEPGFARDGTVLAFESFALSPLRMPAAVAAFHPAG